MTYTPSTLKTKVNPNNFGALRTDANRIALTGSTGNTFQTQDATGTPITSPITVNTTKTLAVPTGAVQLLIMSVTNAVQISEDSTNSTYFSLPAATPLWIDCAAMNNIYLTTGSSTVVSTLWKIV